MWTLSNPACAAPKSPCAGAAARATTGCQAPSGSATLSPATFCRWAVPLVHPATVPATLGRGLPAAAAAALGAHWQCRPQSTGCLHPSQLTPMLPACLPAVRPRPAGRRPGAEAQAQPRQGRPRVWVDGLPLVVRWGGSHKQAACMSMRCGGLVRAHVLRWPADRAAPAPLAGCRGVPWGPAGFKTGKPREIVTVMEVGADASWVCFWAPHCPKQHKTKLQRCALHCTALDCSTCSAP